LERNIYLYAETAERLNMLYLNHNTKVILDPYNINVRKFLKIKYNIKVILK
jgi:hypothetical protein